MKTNVLRILAALACTLAGWGLAHGADPRFGLTHQAGEGIGWDEGFTSVEWFQPLYDTQLDVTFADWHVIMDNEGLFSQNLGVGYRYYIPSCDRMFGIYGYYDVRDSDNEIYHQLSIGGESVGEYWDFNTNLYAPINHDDHVLASSGFGNPFYQGNNIVQARTSLVEAALPGFDMEVGLKIPLKMVKARWYSGWYGFEESSNDTAFGLKGRLEGNVTENITASLGIQDDDIFGTTVTFGAAWYWRGFVPRLGDYNCEVCQGTAYQRLATPVKRNYQIAVQQRTVDETRALTDPDTFDRIIVRHVDNTAAEGGLGTFESPFNELNDAQATSTPDDIIFVQLGDGTSTGMDQGIRLLPGQRLLSESVEHDVETVELGLIQLPGFNPGPLPLITNLLPGGNVVTLADDTEVSGFNIFGAEGAGVFASNADNVDINRNIIRLNEGSGVSLQDVGGANIITDNVIAGNGAGTGTGDGVTIASGTAAAIFPVFGSTTVVQRNTITGNDGDGVASTFASGSSGTVIVLDNTITDNNGNGVSMALTDALTDARLFVDDNVISTNGQLLGLTPTGNGVFVSVADAAALDLFVTNNTIATNFLNGISIVGSDAATIGSVADPVIIGDGNRILDNGRVSGGIAFGDGIDILLSDAAQMELVVESNQIALSRVHGIQISTTGAAIINGSLVSNLITDTGTTAGVFTPVGDAIQLSAVGTSQMLFGNELRLPNPTRIESNFIFNYADRGVFATSAGTARLELDLLDNTIDGDGVGDVSLQIDSLATSILNANISGNIARNNVGDGMVVTATAPGAVVDITSNIVLTNGANGIVYNAVGANPNLVQIDDNVVQGNLADGIVFNGTAAGARYEIDDNIVQFNFGDGITYNANGADNDGTISENDVFSNGGQGIQFFANTANNDVDMLGNSVQFNAGDGIFYTAAGAGNSIEIRDSLARDSNVSSNIGDGIQIVLTGGANVRAGVTNNTLFDNGGFGFGAQTNGTSVLNLQFFGNTAVIAGSNNAGVDYRFQEVAGTFLFESPFADFPFLGEAPPFPGYTGTTNQPGVFLIDPTADDVPRGSAGFGIFTGPPF